jgi:hypothetical protein
LRFGILANLPSVKVVSGESMLTSIRQGFSLAQRRAGAHGNHIRQHSIDGESAVLLTLEGRSNKKAAPCGGTAPGGCAHLVNASAAALSGVGGLNSDSVRLSDLARALDGECKLESAGRPPDGHHPTRASAHGLGNPLKRASSVMIYNEKDRQTQDSPRQRS